MELNELRKIAEAVKQESWVLAGGNEWISPIGITVDYDNGGVSSIEAEFIATFDPPTVLALITELETFRRRLDAMRRQRDGYRNQLRKAEQQVARVREAVKDAPTSDPTRGFAGPPDDYPDIGDFIGNGEWAVAERVRRALDGDGRG